jgi:2-polyprenyl-3-methyl-5-hydroxy-6-metoxy-1,4-benzoquinol methylase
VTRADLSKPLAMLPDAHFDLIHANQVIEHVPNVDLFVSEIYRLLRPGGHAVVSTENGSSWHNVFAAAMGWQIFSLTNVSSLKAGLGNPFAIQRGGDPYTGTWTHKTIFNYRGLIEMFEAHRFSETVVKGAGYFPLPAFLGRIDPRHSAFITILARK